VTLPQDTKTIPQMTLGSTPLSGNELIEISQAGETRKVLANAFPPIGAAYITLANNGFLTGSRTLIAGTGIAFVDNGAGSTVVISASAEFVPPDYTTLTPAAGTHHDQVLPGSADFVLDIDTTAGDMTFDGFVAQHDGQKLYITNTGVNLLTLGALTGSAAANQLRLPTDISAFQNNTVTLMYVEAITKWIAT
jgi:hypothetical protein